MAFTNENLANTIIQMQNDLILLSFLVFPGKVRYVVRPDYLPINFITPTSKV